MKKIPPYVLFLAKDYRTTTSGWQGASYFRRYGRELVSKPAIIFVKEKLGGLPQNDSGLPSLLLTTVPALIFIARRIQHFLPSSIRVDLYLPTLIRGRFQQLFFVDPFFPAYFCK